VHFDYDKADLKDDARSMLAKNADWLKKPHVTAVLLVEGHCDEGTERYNLALGERAPAAMSIAVAESPRTGSRW
jgi:outer membrane protein OmpA-like peptidoglycan-associated protein